MIGVPVVTYYIAFKEMGEGRVQEIIWRFYQVPVGSTLLAQVDPNDPIYVLRHRTKSGLKNCGQEMHAERSAPFSYTTELRITT
jgi:hypothetical protein